MSDLSREQIAERIERIDGVLAAAVALDSTGAPAQIWVAVDGDGTGERVRAQIGQLLEQLQLDCPQHAIRVGLATDSVPRHAPPGDVPFPFELPARPTPTPPAPEPGEGDDHGDVATGGRRFLVFEGLETRSVRNTVVIRATLRRGAREFTGQADDVDTETGRARAAARALLAAAAEAAAGPRLALDALQIVPLFGRRYVALSVEATLHRRVAPLSAMIAIDGSLEQAAALAALAAVERWIAW